MIRNFFISALAVAIVFYILPSINIIGSTPIEKTINVFIIAIIIAALNLTVKPILKIVTLPINIITLGLFGIIINAFIIYIADAILSTFSITGFWNYIIFAVLLSIVNIGLSIFKDNE